MDANKIVGVGNIYACEALFRSGISPFRKSNNISSKEVSLLCEQIKEVLQEAIKSGGSTLKDYVRSSGDSGYFQHSFMVYGRKDESCTKCKSLVKRKKQGGRSTFYCNKCQK